MKDADDGTDEVIRIGICTEMAAVDRALDQSEECAVGQATRAFDEAPGAARNRNRNGVDGGKVERLAAT